VKKRPLNGCLLSLVSHGFYVTFHHLKWQFWIAVKVKLPSAVVYLRSFLVAIDTASANTYYVHPQTADEFSWSDRRLHIQHGVTHVATKRA